MHPRTSSQAFISPLIYICFCFIPVTVGYSLTAAALLVFLFVQVMHHEDPNGPIPKALEKNCCNFYTVKLTAQYVPLSTDSQQSSIPGEWWTGQATVGDRQRCSDHIQG
jgi:hypothetical protein